LGINHPLLACIERVTIAANLNTHGGLGRACVEHVAARASNHGVEELGVNICFHNLPLVEFYLGSKRHRAFENPPPLSGT
jgi:hypothetical protein